SDYGWPTPTVDSALLYGVLRMVGCPHDTVCGAVRRKTVRHATPQAENQRLLLGGGFLVAGSGFRASSRGSGAGLGAGSGARGSGGGFGPFGRLVFLLRLRLLHDQLDDLRLRQPERAASVHPLLVLLQLQNPLAAR